MILKTDRWWMRNVLLTLVVLLYNGTSNAIDLDHTALFVKCYAENVEIVITCTAAEGLHQVYKLR